MTGASIEVFFADRTLETFGKRHGGLVLVTASTWTFTGWSGSRCVSHELHSLQHTLREGCFVCRGLMTALSAEVSMRYQRWKMNRYVEEPKEEILSVNALPERGVTVHSGDMGYTIGPFAGSARCPGRCVNLWMNG